MAKSTTFAAAYPTSELLGRVCTVMGLPKSAALDAFVVEKARQLGIEDRLCHFEYKSGGRVLLRKHDRYLHTLLLQDADAPFGYTFGPVLLDSDTARELADFIDRALSMKSIGVEIGMHDGFIQACRRGPTLTMELHGASGSMPVYVAARIARQLRDAADKLDAMPAHGLSPTPTPA